MPLDELLALYGYEASDPISEQGSESSDTTANLPDMTLDKVSRGGGGGSGPVTQPSRWPEPPRWALEEGRSGQQCGDVPPGSPWPGHRVGWVPTVDTACSVDGAALAGLPWARSPRQHRSSHSTCGAGLCVRHVSARPKLPSSGVLLRRSKQTKNVFFALSLKGTNSEGFALRGRRGRDTVVGR